MGHLLEWCWTGNDALSPHGVSFGAFPLLPLEQLDHIKGVLSRSGVGQAGDDKVQEYLSHARQRLPWFHRSVDGDYGEIETESDDDEAPPSLRRSKTNRTSCTAVTSV